MRKTLEIVLRYTADDV
ncbi:hypothetical protein AB3Y67_000585 [Citrobacter freundii]